MTRRWIGPKHAPAVVLAVLTSLVLLGTASTAVAVPRNDDFAHARAVRAGTTVKGNVNGATRQRGEPRHANSLAMRSVWYRFRAKRKVTLALGTCRTTFDSVIAVYTGRSLRTLREVEFNNNGCGGGGGSRVAFTAKPGRTYRIAVAGFTASGRFRLAVTSVPVPPNDDFADAARLDLGSPVSGTTRNATREAREPSHNFNGARTVWFRLSVDTGSVVRLDACNRSAPAIAVYTGRRVGRLTRIPAAERTLDSHCSIQFAAQPGIAYRLVLENGAGSGGGFRLSGRLAAPPGNDNFADATPISLGATINATTRDATVESGEGNVASPAATVWYQLMLPATTTVRLENCPVGSLGVATGSRVDQLTFDFRYARCPSQATLEPDVYFIRVGTEEGDFTFHTTTVTPPANDDFADATPITFGTTANGTTRYATRELFEPGGGPFTVWYRFSLDATTTLEFECDPGAVQLNDYVGVSQVAYVSCSDDFGVQQYKLPPGQHSIQVQSEEEVDFNFRAEVVTPP